MRGAELDYRVAVSFILPVSKGSITYLEPNASHQRQTPPEHSGVVNCLLDVIVYHYSLNLV